MDSISIFFLIAALNGLEVLSADMQNAYLSAFVADDEKYYTIAKESNGFMTEQDGNLYIIARVLYGLPIAWASFKTFLTKHLRKLGYTSCKADPDLHIQETLKKMVQSIGLT